MTNRPSFPIGINVIVVRDKKILLGKRKNSYGEGTWALPGGHLEEGEGMEEAAVMMTGLNVDRVMQGLAVLESQGRGDERMLQLVEDYTVPNVSHKVVRLILSYTDYVKRVVWRDYSGR